MTTLSSLPLLALAEYPAIGESLIFQFNGLVVVFTALASIWLLLELSGTFFRRRITSSSPATAGESAAPPVTPATDEPSPAVIAVIMAAVHVSLGERRHRVTAIASASPSPEWAREGRREIFSSHRVR